MAYLTCELFAAIQFFPLSFFSVSLHLSDMSKEIVRYGIPRTRMTLVLIGRPCFGGEVDFKNRKDIIKKTFKTH